MHFGPMRRVYWRSNISLGLCANQWWRRPCRKHYKSRQQRCTVPVSQRKPSWQPWLLFHHLDTACLPSPHHSPSLTSFVCLFLPHSGCHEAVPVLPIPLLQTLEWKAKKTLLSLCKCSPLFFFFLSQSCFCQVITCLQPPEMWLNLLIIFFYVRFYTVQHVMLIPTGWSYSFSMIGN